MKRRALAALGAVVLLVLVGACGYTFGLTCRSARATFADGLLDLPRLDVDGEAGLEGFLRLLEPASTRERARPSRAAGW